MLTKVNIENFLTIEKISIDTGSNIVAIMGESGAGKSLVLKAIESVFSQKTPTNTIGRFSDKSSIKLFFSLNKKQGEELSEFGIDEDEIVIEKIIKPKKTKTFINHEPISPKIVFDIKDILLNIVSQNYRFRFFESSNLLSVFDKLVNNKIKDEFKTSYEQFLNAEKEKKDIENKIHLINEKHPEILLESIESINPDKGEYDALLKKLSDAKSSSFVKEKSFEIADKLYENDNSAESLLIEVHDLFEKMDSMGRNVDKIMSAINNAIEILSDIKTEIYNMQKDAPIEDIDEIESRLFELEQLQRKFSKPLDEIVDEKEKLQKMLEEKEMLQLELDNIKKEINIAFNNLSQKASLLSNSRVEASNKIKSQIESFLKDMLMENSVVEFVFSEKNIDSNGKDLVEILFSANPDIQADKIEKTASGGERSRFILAMEAANSTIKNNSETLILDEIEAGISDKTLKKTADVIKKLSKNNQIILVTHNKNLSEIADRLFKIEKQFDGKLTRSFARQIK